MKKTLIALSCFVLSGLVYSQAPKYSNEFLNIGVGAGPMAMAGASIASTSDENSGYWNPAGLAFTREKAGIGLMHAEYFAGMAKYDHGAGYLRLDSSSVAGFSVIRFGIDDIPNTLELIDADGNMRYDRIKTFSAADYAFVFSYARRTAIEGLSLGANAKLIYRQTGQFASAYGFGLDAGIQYRKGKWSFAAMGRDITSTFNAWRFNTDEMEEVFLLTGNEIPENSLELTLPRLIAGVAREFVITPNIGALAEVNASFTFDGKRPVLIPGNPVSIDPVFGLELDYREIVFLRGGMGNIQKVPGFDKTDLTIQPNLGLGIKLKRVRIDYALTDIGDGSISLYSNIFSLGVYFK